MVHCCVVGCSNRTETRPELSFHAFPGRPWENERRKMWFVAVKRKNPDGSLWEPNPCGAKVCSEHFVGGKISNVMTHPAYIPSIFPGRYQKRKMNETAALRRYDRSKRRSRCKPITSLPEQELPAEVQTPEDANSSTSAVATQVNFDYDANYSKFEFIATREEDGFSTYCRIMAFPTTEKKDACCGTRVGKAQQKRKRQAEGLSSVLSESLSSTVITGELESISSGERLSAADHFPKKFEMSAAPSRTANKRARKTCRHCKKRTQFYCDGCLPDRFGVVGLCPECFRNYHHSNCTS